MDSPLILIVELINLMSLHVTSEDRLRRCVEDNGHLEEEEVVGGGWSTSHIVAHAVEVVAVPKEFAGESAEDQNILSILLHSSTSLSLWEDLVIDINLCPATFVILIISLNRIDILSCAVSYSTKYVYGCLSEGA